MTHAQKTTLTYYKNDKIGFQREKYTKGRPLNLTDSDYLLCLFTANITAIIDVCLQ